MQRALILTVAFLSTEPSAAQISVYSATYGANWGAYGNATPQLTAACNGRFNCSYAVSVYDLGDPFPGYPKNFVAQWWCAGDASLHSLSLPPEAGWGSLAYLSCPYGASASAFSGWPPPVQAVAPGVPWQSQYSPWLMHQPGWGSWVMYYCKNSGVNGDGRDRVWRAESWTGGGGSFVNDTIAIEGIWGSETHMSCSPGVMIDSQGTWHMYYITSAPTPNPPPYQGYCDDTYIHHAVSQNPGLSWTLLGRVAGIVQPAPNCGFETPSPILVNGQIVLYWIRNGHVEKATSLDGHNFSNPTAVGTVDFVSHGRVTDDNGWYYFVYSTDPTHMSSTPTEIRFSGPAFGSDSFAAGDLHLQVTPYSWYSKAVWSPHLLLGSDGQPSRIYFAGNTPDPGWWGGNGSIGALSGQVRHVLP